MKQLELVKLADGNWVRKSAGYRIRCNEPIEDGRADTTMPSEGEPAMESDVLAWRVAFKLAQEQAEDGLPKYRDITVVDDQGKPMVYYASGKTEILNPQE